MTAISAATSRQSFIASIAPKEAKFSLNIEDIPDTRVLEVFQKIGFSVPTSTFDLKENNVQKLGECFFDRNATFITFLAIDVAALALLILAASTVGILAPPVTLGLFISVGTILAFLFADTTCDFPVSKVLAGLLKWAREKVFGKYDARGQYLTAQNEFAEFINKNSPAIKDKLQKRLAAYKNTLADLSRLDLSDTPEVLKEGFERHQEETAQTLKQEIAFTEDALVQLEKAEATAKSL
jgi:hypothetical protein